MDNVKGIYFRFDGGNTSCLILFNTKSEAMNGYEFLTKFKTILFALYEDEDDSIIFSMVSANYPDMDYLFHDLRATAKRSDIADFIKQPENINFSIEFAIPRIGDTLYILNDNKYSVKVNGYLYVDKGLRNTRRLESQN